MPTLARPPYIAVWHPLISHRIVGRLRDNHDGRHQGGTMVQCRGRGAQGGYLKIWSQPVGSLCLSARKEDGKAVQGAMERMARSFVCTTKVLWFPRLTLRSIKPSCYPPNGARSRPSSDAQRHSAWSDTRSSWTTRRRERAVILGWLAQRVEMPLLPQQMKFDDYVLERLMHTVKPGLRSPMPYVLCSPY
jgi:hypothetical protein